MKRIIMLLSIVALLYSCKKDDRVIESFGTVKDYTGFDGCGMMIVLNNGSVLEIHSFPPGTTLVDGKKVAIRYNTILAPSVCMMGETIDITSLRYL